MKELRNALCRYSSIINETGQPMDKQSLSDC